MNPDTIRNTASKNRIAALLGLVLTVAAVNVFAYTGQKLAGEAKVSMDEARAIALKLHPGKITEEGRNEEVEEGTGTRWVLLRQTSATPVNRQGESLVSGDL
ncbi:MAG: PepSY domain-containing protein [Sulfuricella sp.]